MSDLIRINKYLAHLGVASRRKIDEYIDQKRIEINGKLAKNGDKILPGTDKITIDGKPIKEGREELVYIILNKPLKIISSVSDNLSRGTVTDIVKIPQRVYPVGRLDYETTGLILLTNDGTLAYRLTHPKYHFPKTYLATVSGHPSPAQLDLLASGVPLEDGITSKTDIEIFHSNNNFTTIKITLYEGKNRQIRRMCDTVGLNLTALKRISIGPIELGNLKEGEWRNLTPAEVKRLQIV